MHEKGGDRGASPRRREIFRAAASPGRSAAIVAATISILAVAHPAAGFAPSTQMMLGSRSRLGLPMGGSGSRAAAPSLAPLVQVGPSRLSAGGGAGMPWTTSGGGTGRCRAGAEVVAARQSSDGSSGGDGGKKKGGGLAKLRDVSVKLITMLTNLTVSVIRLLSRQGLLVVMVVVALSVGRMNARKNAAAGGGKGKVPEVAYSQFLERVNKGDVEDCALKPTSVTFKLKNRPGYMVTRIPRAPAELVSTLSAKNVNFWTARPSPGSMFVPYIGLLIYMGFVGFLGWQMMGKGVSGKVGKRADPQLLDRSLTFDDVAGIDEAKGLVMQVVDVMKNPSRYTRLGARAPTGVLLCGPPGTGKTLLARVIAGQMNLPFFYASGSDFVEMFVGRGAARIRELFARAAKSSPAVIFLDELDAVGKSRTGGILSRNDEGEQTLNQLLASLDGIDTKGSGIVIIGATNRYDVLDPALTRPGRFDRVVNVELPNKAGREAVLKVHCRQTLVGGDVNLASVAEATEGFSPAELSAIVNEAIINAASRNANQVNQNDFDKVLQVYKTSRGIGGIFSRRR